MTAAQLIEKLQFLVSDHGDLPISLVVGKYEFVLNAINHNPAGPLPHLRGIQTQAFSERIVLAGAPGVEDSTAPIP